LIVEIKYTLDYKMTKLSEKKRIARQVSTTSEAVVEPQPEPEVETQPQPEVEERDEKGRTPAQQEHMRKLRDDAEYRKEWKKQKKKRREERKFKRVRSRPRR
jgi:hypothetical protein